MKVGEIWVCFDSCHCFVEIKKIYFDEEFFEGEEVVDFINIETEGVKVYDQPVETLTTDDFLETYHKDYEKSESGKE